MEFRYLTVNDSAQLDRLIGVIESSIPDKSWWLPIQTLAKDHFFDPEWTVIYGAFEDGMLVASSSLFLTDNEFGEAAAAIGLDLAHVAEIGRCMVDPSYRGQNLMLRLNGTLVEHARKSGIHNIVATAHPSNVPSCTSLLSLGLHVAGKIVKYETYERNIFLLSL